jgi:hypothetical protein
MRHLKHPPFFQRDNMNIRLILSALMFVIIFIAGQKSALADPDIPGVVGEYKLNLNLNVLGINSTSSSTYSESSADLLEDSFDLKLSENKTVKVILDRKTVRSSSDYTWFGHIENMAFSSVVFVVRNGKITGSVAFPEGNYSIKPTGDSHTIYEIDTSLLPDALYESEENDDFQGSMSIPMTSYSGAYGMSADEASYADEAPVIDLLVLYTDAAAEKSDDILADIQLAVDQTNQSFVDSRINASINIVHTHQLSGYSETDQRHLDRLKAPGDEDFAVTHILRQKYNADLITVFVETAGAQSYCGLGSVLGDYHTEMAEKIYSTAIVRKCTTYTLAHEIGHNMGAHHDRYVQSMPSYYNYSFGFVDIINGWRTIMSYSNKCSDFKTSCGRIGYFSNPDINYEGAPLGSPEGQFNSANSAKTLDNLAATVASYRDSSTNNTLSIYPALINYGIVTSTQEKTFQVSNSGDSNIVLNTLVLNGDAKDNYTIINDQCSSTTLSPLSYCTFDVKYTKSGIGFREAEVEVSSSTAGIETAVLGLTAAVTEETLHIEVEGLDSRSGSRVVSRGVHGAYRFYCINQGDFSFDGCHKDTVKGYTVEILAFPDPGTVFTGWSGYCNGTEPSCQVTMNEETTLTAHFAPLTVASVPFEDRFTNYISSPWTLNSTTQGSIIVDEEDDPVDDGQVKMSCTEGDGNSCLNEMTLSLNLEGARDVYLYFLHKKAADESDNIMPSSFSGNHNSDGIAISVDNETWHKIQGLTSQDEISENYKKIVINLDEAADQAGITYSDSIKIRFQHYESNTNGSSGHYFDNIYITGRQNSPDCEFSLASTALNAASSASEASVDVTSRSDCYWDAESNDSWITIDSGSNMSGNQTVSFSIEENPTINERTGTLTIAGHTFTVNQSGQECSYSLGSQSADFTASGGDGSISITSLDGCDWNAAGTDDWITINNSNGSGSGTVNYNVAANSETSTRTGTITVAGLTFTVNQDEFVSGPVTVNESGTISKNDWHHYGPFDTGEGDLVAEMTGSGDVDLYVKKGSQPTSSSYDCRPYESGTNESCTVAGPGDIYVSVKGFNTSSTYELTITYEPAEVCEDVTTYGINSQENCYDVFESSCLPDGWENPSTTIPQGVEKCPNVIDITVNESGNIQKDAWDHYGPYSVYEGNIQVDMTGDNDADLYVRKGSEPTSGSYDCRPYESGTNESCTVAGPGDIYVSVQGYSSSGSNYNLTISYKGIEESSCSYELSESSLTLSADASSSLVELTTTEDCDWTAESNAAWLTIDSSSTGAGNATISFSASENTNGNSRSAILSIAGQSLTVTQQGQGCGYSLGSSSLSIGADGGQNSVELTTISDCDWQASSNNSWITLDSAVSGSGSSTIEFTVEINNSSNARTGTLSIAGNTFTVTQQGQDCTYSLGSDNLTVEADGGQNSVELTTISDCDWQASSNDSWITLDSAASGSGSSTIEFSVEINNSSSSRTGTLTIAGLTFTVTQQGRGCNYSLDSNSISLGADGGQSSVELTTISDCDWQASSNDSWITLDSAASGSGSSTVEFSIEMNSTYSARTGTLTIAGQTFTVSQQGQSCDYSLDVDSLTIEADGGQGSVELTAASDCDWQASSNDSWITLDSAASGNGSSTIEYTVELNNSSSERTGTLTIAGLTFTVTQQGQDCNYSLGADSFTIEADGGQSSVELVAASGCEWQANSNDSWINLDSSSSGNGNSTIEFTVDMNNSSSERTGTLTIAGLTFTVTQQGQDCTYSLSATSVSISHEGGSFSVNITAPDGCGWNNNNSNDWITVNSGGSGDGNGTLNYTVDANTNLEARSGNLLIAGNTLTINQEAMPAVSENIAPEAEASAQSTYQSSSASKMNDDDESSTWYSSYLYSNSTVWVKLEWSENKNINSIEIIWSGNYKADEIDVWTRNSSWSQKGTYSTGSGNTIVDVSETGDAIWILLKEGQNYFGIKEIIVN